MKFNSSLNTFMACFIVLFISCAPDHTYLKQYTDQLPENEAINASIYNYELIVSEIKKKLNEEKYAEVFRSCLAYYEIFEYEDDYGLINKALALVIPKIIDTDDFHSCISNLNTTQMAQLGIDKIKGTKNINNENNQIPQYMYSNFHLNKQLDDRVGYELEKEAVEKLYLPILEDDQYSLKKKLDKLEFFFRRFPDSKLVNAYLKSEKFSKLHNSLNMTKKNKLTEWTNGVISCQHASDVSNVSDYYFVQGQFMTVRNKYNYIKSRHLATLQGWEEVEVHGIRTNNENSGNDEDNKIWADIEYRDGRRGFLEKIYLISKTNEKYTAIHRISEKQRKAFRHASTLFFTKKYIQAAEKTAKIIEKTIHQPLKENAIALLFNIHLEISRRATSIDNPYLKYVEKYPLYFQLDADGLSLTSSRLLFNYLLSLNPDSELIHLLIQVSTLRAPRKNEGNLHFLLKKCLKGTRKLVFSEFFEVPLSLSTQRVLSHNQRSLS